MAEEVSVDQPIDQPQDTTVQAQAPDKPSKLYGALIASGLTKDNLGSEDEFKTKVSDPGRAGKLYDQLINIGFSPENLHGDKNTFVGEISSKPPLKPSSVTPSSTDLNSLTTQQKSVTNSPVIDPNLSKQISSQKPQGQVPDAQAAEYKKVYNALPDDSKKGWDTALKLAAVKPADEIRGHTPEEIRHENFMVTPLGKTLGSVAYLGSKATKGTVQIAKGASWAAGVLTGQDNELTTKNAFDTMDKASDYGLTESDKAHMESGDSFGGGSKGAFAGGVLKSVGTLAEIAPAAETGNLAGPLGLEGQGLSKAMFALQGFGQASDITDKLEKSGTKLNGPVKNLFIGATGAANALFMGDLGETLFGKMSADARGAITTKVAYDALLKASEKGASADALPGLISDGAKTFAEKFATGGYKYLNKVMSTTVDLAKLNTANALIKEGVNKVEGKDVFHDTFGDYIAGLNDMVTKQAPFFAGFNKGTVEDALTMASPNSGFRNEITTSLVHDSSPDNVAAIKQKVYDYGMNDPRGQWTPEQLGATMQTVDKIAKTAQSLPKTVRPGHEEKALGILYGRNELQSQLEAVQSTKENADPALKDIPSAYEQALSDKIDQANDKLVSSIRGGKITYSFDPEKNQAYKTNPDGTKEKISQSRYELETAERAASKKLQIDHSDDVTNFAASVGATEKSGNTFSTPEDSAVDIKISPTKDDKTFEIKDLGVPEETRRLGLAKQKLNELTEKANEAGVTLTTKIPEDPTGGLKRLFEGHGFRESGGVLTREPYVPEKPEETNLNNQENENQSNGEESSSQNPQGENSQSGNGEESPSNAVASEKEITPDDQEKIDSLGEKIASPNGSRIEASDLDVKNKFPEEVTKAVKKAVRKRKDQASGEAPITSSEGKIAELDSKIEESKKALIKKISTVNATGPFHALPELIKLGSLYVQRGIVKFSDFAAELRKDYNQSTGKDLPLSDREIAAQVYKKSMADVLNNNVVDPIGKRGFGERMFGAPDTTPEMQDYIDNNPDHDYVKQKIQDVKDQLNLQSEQQLVSHMTELQAMANLTSDTNVGVLAAKKLLEDAITSGDKQKESDIFAMLDKAGTSIGQMLRQFAEIKGVSAKFFVNAVEKKLELSGRFLTDPQKKELTDYTEDYLKKSLDAKEKFLDFVESLDPKDKETADAARKEADKAYEKLVKKQSDFDVRGFWDTAGTIMQGNLLTTVSQIANPIYNAAFLPYRIGTKLAANTIDAIVAAATGKERTTSYSLFQAKQEAQGFIGGLGQAGKTFVNGVHPGEQSKIESYRGLRPLDALVSVFTGKNIPGSHDPLQYAKDRYLTKTLEGVFGAPAELMYRMLSFGDKPFYQSAYRGVIAQEAVKRGLKGDERTRFVLNPDLPTIKRAMDYADEATFQNENKASVAATNSIGFINKALQDIPVVGDFAKFALKSVIPFVKTPTNVIIETASYVMPEISALQFAGSIKNMRSAMVEMKGKLEAAKKAGASTQSRAKIKADGIKKVNEFRGEAIKAAAKGVIARTLKTGAMWIVSHGFYTGSLDDDQKKRSLQYEAGKPNAVNVTAMNRFIQGGNEEWQPDDKFVGLDKFGMFGASIAIQGNAKAQEELDGKEPSETTDLWYGMPALLKFSLDQSFLKGTNTMLDAITKGDYSQIAPNVAASMYSVVVPNTWSSFARANRDYMVNKKDPDKWTTVENAIKEKTYFDPKLPSQVGLWGQKVGQTPEGRNPYLYQLLDITKYNTLSEDPVSMEVMKVARETKNSAVIPTKPDGNYMLFGNKYTLSAKDLEKRQELVGESAHQMYVNVMSSDSYKTQSPEVKAMSLSMAGNMASKIGNLRFEGYVLKQHPDMIKEGQKNSKENPGKPLQLK